MTIEVTQASIDRVPELAPLTGRAFADDPNAVWSLGAEATESQVVEWFRAFQMLAASHGFLWEAGRGLGAAVWFPPGEAERYLHIDQEARSAAASLSDDGGVRSASYWDWIAAQLPPEPHWFLDHIAVRADQRGKGIGRALIDVGLSGARSASVPAFLETARPENVPIYEHIGFRVTLDDDAPWNGPHVWFMRFDP